MSTSVPPPTEEPSSELEVRELRAAAQAERRWIFWTRTLVIVGAILLWEMLVRLGLATELMAGQPSRVLHFLSTMVGDGSVVSHTLVTVYETLMGFVFGFFGGAALGLLMWWSRLAGKVLDPVIVALNSLPKIALTPVFLLWFGAGALMKVALSFSTVFLVSFLAAYSSLAMVDRELLQLAASMGGTKRQIFLKIVIPSSIPWLLAAMKLCIGFALTGAVVGEFVAANEGLGYLLLYAAQLYEMSLVWAGIFILLVLAVAMYLAVAVLERLSLRWMQA